jgi:ethanolamine permease
MVVALFVLSVFAGLLVLFGPGAVGSSKLLEGDDPLVVALSAIQANPRDHWALTFVNVAGLAGLIACLFSAIYGYSRQTFSLARAGHLPAWLSRTSGRLVPVYAIVVPSVVACALALADAAEPLFVLMVSAGTLSYLFMIPSHWRMRTRATHVPGTFRTPGGRWTSAFAWLASSAMFMACFLANPGWSSVTLAVVFLVLVRYVIQRRRRPQPRPAPDQRIVTD